MFREKRQIFLVLVIFLILNQLISYFVIRSTVAANLAGAQSGLSLSKANRSAASISVWANTAAVDIFSYNYRDIDARFNAISRYFTLDQWKSYSAQIKASGAFDNVKKQKMLVGAVATGPVEIIHQGVVKGSYQWTVKVPLLVVYTTADKKAQQQLDVEMVIARQPNYINASGLAINQFSAAESNTGTASTKSSG